MKPGLYSNPISVVVRNERQQNIVSFRRQDEKIKDVVYNFNDVLPYNNDEQERAIRRSRLHTRKNLSMAEAPPKELTIPEARKLFDLCVKMNLENKINVNNVWSLNIIDSTLKLLESKAFNKNTLQAASASLDVSSKVYGIRVDCIHADGMKLASAMARVRQQEYVERDEQEENVDATRRTPKRKRLKRLMGNQKSTIVKDINSLRAPIPKLQSTFFQTASSTQLSTIDNFFSSKQPLNHCGCKLMMVSSGKYMNQAYNFDATVSSNKFQSLPLDRSQMLWSGDLCADFYNFELGVWDPENDEFSELFHTSDSLHNDELFLDELRIPMAELDGPIQDTFEALDPPMDTSNECHESQINPPFILPELPDLLTCSNIEDFLNNNLHQSIAPTNLDASQMWAGPSHWKLKHIHPTETRFSGIPSEQSAVRAKKPKAKDPQMIDFNVDIVVDNSEQCIYKKKPDYNPMDDRSCRFTLPESFIETEGLFMKASVMGNPENRVAVVEMEDDADEDVEQNHYEPLNSYVGDNLIELPNHIPKTTLGYSRQAKSINMKKLKTAIWKILIKDTKNSGFQDELFKKRVHKTTFRHVYRTLRGLLSAKMKQQLSCSLAFTALLHLANQCTLRLTSGADLHDVTIEQD